MIDEKPISDETSQDAKELPKDVEQLGEKEEEGVFSVGAQDEESKPEGAEPEQESELEPELELELELGPQLPTIGEQLKTLRLARRLTIADVANNLRLRSVIINDIETNVYEGEWTTFTKGYVKSYAKIVGMPEQVVDTLLGIKKSAEPHTSFQVNAKMHETTTKDKRFRVVTYLIIVILIALIVLWRYMHHVNYGAATVAVPGQVDQRTDSATQDLSTVTTDTSTQATEQQQSAEQAGSKIQMTKEHPNADKPKKKTIVFSWQNPDAQSEVKTTR